MAEISKSKQYVKSRKIVSLSDCSCPICMYIVIEPVTLPCGHELCMPCYKEHVSKANLCCPLCRTRLSVWARRAARENKLINQQRWREIQEAYPEQVKNRLEGREDDSLDYERDVFFPCLAEPGELRKEYENEQEKISEERRLREQEEEEASRALIDKLQRELEAEDEAVRRAQREQEDRDLLLAAKLSKELNGETPDIVKNQPIARDATLTPTTPVTANLSRSDSFNRSQNSKRPTSKHHSPTTTNSATSSEQSQGHLKLWYRSKPKSVGESSTSSDTSQSFTSKNHLTDEPSTSGVSSGWDLSHNSPKRVSSSGDGDIYEFDVAGPSHVSPRKLSREKRPSGEDSTSFGSQKKRFCFQEMSNSPG